MCSTKPINSRVGNTISQSTSGERTVNGLGTPPQIRPNTRIIEAQSRVLVTSTSPAISTGALLAMASSSSSRRAAKPPKGGRAIRPKAPARKAMPISGRRLHRPPSWVRSWVTLPITMAPTAISITAIGSGYTSSRWSATSMPPRPTATNSSPSQLLTRKLMARFTSICPRAIRAATRAVVPPTTTSTPCTRGLRAISGSSRSSTQAPPSTTTELRSTVEGSGLSIASSSHRCSGIWAHLPMGPAIRASRISWKPAGNGWPLLVRSAAQPCRPWKFQVPVSGSRAITPASSTMSPMRLVRKASRAPFTTSDWLYQVPTIT